MRRAALAGFMVLVAVACLAPDVSAADDAGNNGPALPRFESLRWDKVNLRAGPGDQYPIKWVLTRKGMPVEVLDRFDIWRKIRDWQGSTGWVHERMLIGNRTIIVTGAERVIHAAPSRDAAAVARAQIGVVARLLACNGFWCRIDAQGIKGWLERGQFFGVLPEERVH
jgi:SH3-like domain-containing protein